MRVTVKDKDNVTLFEGEYPSRELETALYNGNGALQKSCSTLNHTEVKMEGVNILYGEVALRSPIRILAELPRPSIDMYFLLEGESKLRLQGDKKTVGITGNHHNIGYAPSCVGEFTMLGNTVHRMLEIQMSDDFFMRLIDEDCPTLSRFASNIEKQQVARIAPNNLVITPKMRSAIGEIMSSNRKGRMLHLYLEAKLLELFTMQIEQCEYLYGDSVPKTSLKKGDIDKLHAAKERLEHALYEPPTLLALAREVGINDFKLKKGFRELFGTTVFGYVNDIRMEQAHTMLLDENKTVTEVADALGYSEPHHFSKAFKKKYGYPPRELKQQQSRAW